MSLEPNNSASDGHITIALSAYNCEVTIEKAVRSIMEQSYSNFDLYIVDDASTDRTAEIIMKILPEDERLHLIHLEKNSGTYSAKNLVIRDYCHGEFYAHQDGDDFSWKNRLKKQVELLRSHPQVVACGTGIDEFSEEENLSAVIRSDFPTVYDEVDRYYHRKNLYPMFIDPISVVRSYMESAEWVKIAMNGSILFRTQIIKQLGGFDGRTRISGDLDLLFRMLLLYDFANLQEVLYSRKYHAKSLTKSETLGHGTPHRTEYRNKIRDRLRAVWPLFESGETDKLIDRLKEDMHVAHSPNKLYHGAKPFQPRS